MVLDGMKSPEMLTQIMDLMNKNYYIAKKTILENIGIELLAKSLAVRL